MNSTEIEEALNEAAARHGAQMYGDKSYRFHLEMVVAKMVEIGASRELILAAAWHDAIEDAGVTCAELERKYGADVGAIVWSVSGEGTTRRERTRSIVRKLTDDHRGITLKMGDRYCNWNRAIEEGKWHLVKMYRAEDPLFDPLFAKGEPRLYAQYRSLRVIEITGRKHRA